LIEVKLIILERNMRAVDIIIKKREGLELSRDEIEFFIQGYTRGEIPDYQASAWAMAVVLKGMKLREITDLTLAMAYSGDVIDLTTSGRFVIDKHSTGGVGDKTTLVVEPTVAACGLPVGKMSGRGLGHSGGTLDKLESIPGFCVDLTTEAFLAQLREIGIVLAGQSADLAPADGKLYALRDVTGTVQSVPLIASSVMSKKIAGGANAILLDVKLGRGAFMQDVAEAKILAETMVSIGKHTDRKTIALLSDMNQPLGHAVGNALEVREAVDTLHGQGPEDFRLHCLEVTGHMLVLGGLADDVEAGKVLAVQALRDGRAWAKFRQLISAQGGDVSFVDHPEKLPISAVVSTVPAPRTGYLEVVDAREIGETVVQLGGGRAKKEDQIDHAVGIVVHHKVGDAVSAGESLFTVHARDEVMLRVAVDRVLQAHSWSDQPVPPLPLFYGVIRE
jgi:pyrimidine-nucleoside phosphorylase